jgi:acyl-CoA thioesterase
MLYENILSKLKEMDGVTGGLDIRVTACETGYGKAVMPLDERHKNIMNIAHGGAVFSLADVALTVATLWHGEVCVTLNVNIAFLKPSEIGPLTAEARETHFSGHISHCSAEVRDGEGQIVSLCQGMIYRKKTPLSAVYGNIRA